MRSSSSERVHKHRASLRASGMRPIQIWVPDTRSPSFIQECRRQSLLVAASDSNDRGLTTLMDETLADVDGWEA
jgi:hypothetical protein